MSVTHRNLRPRKPTKWIRMTAFLASNIFRLRLRPWLILTRSVRSGIWGPYMRGGAPGRNQKITGPSLAIAAISRLLMINGSCILPRLTILNVFYPAGLRYVGPPGTASQGIVWRIGLRIGQHNPERSSPLCGRMFFSYIKQMLATRNNQKEWQTCKLEGYRTSNGN